MLPSLNSVNLDFVNKYKINSKELVVGKLIGEGRFSKVYEAHRFQGKVAVKELKINSYIYDYIGELGRCLKIKSHPNIVRIYGFYTSDDSISLVMEKMDYSLEAELDRCRAKGGLTLDEIARLTKQVVYALDFLHESKMTHGCLSPSNILISQQDEINVIKLSDFGMSKIKSGSYSENNIPDKSLLYRPSESFQRGAGESKAHDVFSVGMIIWEMFANKKPFANLTDEQELISFISNGNLEVIPSNCPEPWANLIKKCWNPNPQQRPTTGQIIEELKVITAPPVPVVRSKFVDTYKIDAKELVYGELIGKGKFSEVYEAQWKTKNVAVKRINLNDNFNLTDLKRCIEFSRHTHIVPIYGFCTGSSSLELVMEKMDSSLESELDGRHGKTGFTLDEIALVAKQVVYSLAFLHQNGITHDHLSPSSILRIRGNAIKLSDFGMFFESISSENNIPDKSLRYCPSESIQRGAGLSKAHDVFSVGMIIWEMFANKKPFADLTDETELRSFISKGNLEVIPSNCPEPWANLIKKCWNLNPKQRPKMAQIKQELEQITAVAAPKEAPLQPDRTIPQPDGNDVPLSLEFVPGTCYENHIIS